MLPPSAGSLSCCERQTLRREEEAVAAGAFPSPKKKATLFADIATATGAEAAGAILKYVGLPAPGREKTASGDQIVDPNE